MVKQYGFWGLVLLILVFCNRTFASSITQTPASPVAGCLDTLSTSIVSDSMYYWYFGTGALTQVDSGYNLQTVTNYFLHPGNDTVRLLVKMPGGTFQSDSIIVDVLPSNLDVSLTADTLALCPGTLVRFKASPSTYLFYTFLIDNNPIQSLEPSDTFTTTALHAGDSVTVLAYNGVCYSNPSATLYPVVYPTPGAVSMVSSVPSDTICSGDTVTFTASPAGLGQYWFYVGGSLQQNDNSNVWTTDQLYNGNVVYVKVVQNGCPGVPSVRDTFVVNPTPFVTLSLSGPVTFCQGQDTTFTASSSVANSVFNFYVNSVDSQSGPQNSYTPAVLTNGEVIYATASAQGCTSVPSASADITVNPLPLVSLTAPVDSICQGNPVTFTAAPGTYATYVFYNNGAALQNSSSATYTGVLPANNSVYVEAENLGCSSYSDTVSILILPTPVVSAGPSPQVACLNGPTVTLTGNTPAGGTWSGTGVSQSGIITPASVGVGNTTLTYTYTDPVTGCPASDSIVFTVNPLPVIGLDSSASICIGHSVTLNAGGGSTYAWSPATGLSSITVANPVASPTQTTLYTVIVTNSNNCTDTASVDVQVFPNPSATITVSNVCQGQPADFTGTSVPPTGVTYLWYFGDGDTSSAQDPVHLYTNPDSFSVVLVVALGNCTFADTAGVVVYPTPVANFEANPTQTYNDSTSPVTFVNLSSNSTIWQWNFGDMTGSGLQSPTHVYTQTGAYTVTLIASNAFGCADTLVKPNYIDVFPPPVIYIPNVFSPNGDGNNDILLVKTTGVKFFDMSIFDRWGEKVFESLDVLTGWDGTYKGKMAPVGVYAYIARVVFEDGTPRNLKGSITLLR